MAREPVSEVKLSDRAFPSIRSHLSATVEERGLVISGHDLGSGVSSIWGDSDYEYWLVVRRQHLGRVIERLARKLHRQVDIPDEASERNRLLLELMQQAWSLGLFETDVDFRRWLNAIHVPSEFSSYA